MRRPGYLLLLCVCACRAAPIRSGQRPPAATGQIQTLAPADPVSAGSNLAPRGGVVAQVAGQPVYAADLLAHWMHRDSDSLRGHLENLVFSRLIVAEAHRLGVTLAANLVESRYEAGLKRLAEELEQDEPGLGVDGYIRSRLGLDPERYKHDLRRDLEIDLLAERCVRAWLLASERAEVRVLVVQERAQLEEVQKALAAGGDFAELAKEKSTHESRVDGGRIPPVVRSESGLARLAFATPVGQVGGPIAEEGNFLLLQVTARPEPIADNWSEAGPAVEASLLAVPIADPEYWQWKSAMNDTYEVDLTPLRDLLDAAYETSKP